MGSVRLDDLGSSSTNDGAFDGDGLVTGLRVRDLDEDDGPGLSGQRALPASEILRTMRIGADEYSSR